jgi:hypothetical protein
VTETAQQESTTDAPLAPSKAVIAAHLYALFSPAFVQAYPDSWIEIAHGRPDGALNMARNFPAFDLEDAAQFAVEINAAGYNVYVGAALRHGAGSASGRANGNNVLDASHCWAEYDGAGDDDRIAGILKVHQLTPSLVVTTGTTPDPRRHLYLKLDGTVTPKQLQAANESLRNLLRSDDVRNSDRVMRLAGTVSHPSPKKLAKGYTTELTSLVSNKKARAYKVDELIGLAPQPADKPEGPKASPDIDDGFGAKVGDAPPPGEPDFFKSTNQLAMAYLAQWVPTLFGGKAKFQPGTGAYRVSSATLGRKLDEDLSISPKGIVDFGVADQGDRREGKHTPVDLVVAFGPKNSLGLAIAAADAALWLCEKMGISPEALGWNGPGQAKSTASQTPIHATPYAWTEPGSIPQRQWLYGTLLLRKFVTATISPGGIGKSSLIVAEALAMVSGKGLLGVISDECLRVWVWNLEDPLEETQRKVQAAALHYRLVPDDIGDRLMMDSGRDQKLVIATTTRTGTVIVQPVVDSLVDEIVKYKIDVLVIDPFVSCHEVSENDNMAMDMVVKEWGRVAGRGNCAVHLVHHTRKPLGAETEVTTNSSRGAASQTDACRVVRPLNRMTEKEATAAGVDNHRLYFRTIQDKDNLSPPVEKSDWFRLVSVDLHNGPMGLGGDSIGVVTKWTMPDALAGMTGADFEKVARVIRGGKWRHHPQAASWVGRAVAEALEIDIDNKTVVAKIKRMLGVWYAAKTLVVVERDDDNRISRKFVEVAEQV